MHSNLYWIIAINGTFLMVHINVFGDKSDMPVRLLISISLLSGSTFNLNNFNIISSILCSLIYDVKIKQGCQYFFFLVSS